MTFRSKWRPSNNSSKLDYRIPFKLLTHLDTRSRRFFTRVRLISYRMGGVQSSSAPTKASAGRR
jgi:hypothetical protein